ncbi:MAG TPA: DUF3800 domain-containing protein [Thermoanaerobaculia bacterium]|nr:DUF3800 domain-containing protein [Thermoanaerobaculia bacterium]
MEASVSLLKAEGRKQKVEVISVSDWLCRSSFLIMALLAFLDEAGDHSLDRVDQDFPVFVLVFLLCQEQAYSDVIVPSFTRFKLRHFGHDGVILHSRDIRKAIGDFAFLQVPDKRAPFYSELNQLMIESPIQLIAIAIRKQSHKERYGKACRNPYELALEFGMERLKAYLEELGQKQITLLAEARGRNEDDALRLAFLQLLKLGSYYHEFQSIEFNLKFVPKRSNVLGHQLADLCAYPIGRRVIDPKKSHQSFEIVRRKFLDRPGWRHGFKIFP